MTFHYDGPLHFPTAVIAEVFGPFSSPFKHLQIRNPSPRSVKRFIQIDRAASDNSNTKATNSEGIVFLLKRDNLYKTPGKVMNTQFVLNDKGKFSLLSPPFLPR